MTRRILALVILAGSMAAGCSSEPVMSKQDEAAFRGARSGDGPRSPEAAKAIGDFAEKYRKEHPSAGGPPNGQPMGGAPGQPPAGMPQGRLGGSQ